MIDRNTPLEDLPEFLTPEEFASFLGIGLTSTYEMIRRRQIASRRFGRLIRIPKDALQEVK